MIKERPKVEEPDFDEEDESIMDNYWDNIEEKV